MGKDTWYYVSEHKRATYMIVIINEVGIIYNRYKSGHKIMC